MSLKVFQLSWNLPVAGIFSNLEYLIQQLRESNHPWHPIPLLLSSRNTLPSIGTVQFLLSSQVIMLPRTCCAKNMK